MITLRMTADTISPDLVKRIRKAQNPQPALRAAGTVIEQMAKRAFNTPSLRPHSWANKADGTPARLRKNQILARSPRVTSVTRTEVTVGSDRLYAAIHQLGGKMPPRIIRPKNKKALAFTIGGRKVFAKFVKHPGGTMPARPFFPFYADGSLTPRAKDRVEQVLADKLEP